MPIEAVGKTKSRIVIFVILGLSILSLCIAAAFFVVFLQGDHARQNSGMTSDEDFQQHIARCNASGDDADVMQAEFEYAKWLQGNKRYMDAEPHYKVVQNLAQKNNEWYAWSAVCLDLRGWAQHKLYLLGQLSKPDYKLIEQAIEIQLAHEGENAENRVALLNDMSILYSDNGQFDKARKALETATKLEETQEQDRIPETLLYLTEVNLKQNRMNAAKESFAKAAKYNLHEACSAYTEFLDYIQSSDNSQRREITNKVEQLLAGSKFDELEKMADDLRKSQAMYPSGKWHLDTFYSAASLDEFESEDRWKAHFALIRKWNEQKPQSITARISLADNMVSYAWRARGGGYANTVTGAGWKGFEERIADARKVLNEAKTMKEKCPRFYETMQDVMLAEGENKEAYSDFVEECRKTWPTYWSSAFGEMWFLQPRWYGEGDEWVKTAERIANSAGGGEKSDKAYARMVWFLDAMNKYDNLFEEFPSLSWPRLQSGFKALQQEFPQSRWVELEYVKLETQSQAFPK